jgi:hypothetical protein
LQTRVLPAAPEVIETTAAAPASAPPVRETRRPRKDDSPHHKNDPFWSDPRARDAREDLEAARGSDKLKGF